MTGPMPHGSRDERPMVEIIHEIAEAIGDGAGEPSTEIAGQLVSVVVASPAAGEALRTYGTDALIYGLVPIVGGELTHRTRDGSIVAGHGASAACRETAR